MKPSRTDRLDSEYRREISAILSGALKNRDPRVTGLVSVTEAHVAPDLKTARIYVSVYAKSEEEQKRTFDAIAENAGFIRHELAQIMRMRTVPTLTFLPDDSMAYGSKMDELLAGLHKKDEQ